jgi:hypothetical protein
MKNSNNTIGNRTRDLPVCSAVTQQTANNNNNRSDKSLVYKTNKHSAFIDIAIPLAQSLQATNTEKKQQISETGI